MKLRRRMRTVGAGLGVMLAVGAGGVEAAQAGKSPRWAVKGVFLGNGSTKNFGATSTETTRLHVPGLSKVSLESAKGECTMVGGKIVGSAIETPGTKREVLLACSKVKVVGVPDCTVKSVGYPPGSIAFGNMKSTLVWLSNMGQSAGDLYSAEAVGAPLTELVFEGAICAIAGKYSVKGEIIAPFLPVAEETNSATQGFPEPPILKWWNNEAAREEKSITQLTVGGFNATLQSSFSVALNPVESFSIFEG